MHNGPYTITQQPLHENLQAPVSHSSLHLQMRDTNLNFLGCMLLHGWETSPQGGKGTACSGVSTYSPSPLTTNKSVFDALCGKKRDGGGTLKGNLESRISLRWLLGLFTLIWVHPSPPYQELKEHQVFTTKLWFSINFFWNATITNFNAKDKCPYPTTRAKIKS